MSRLFNELKRRNVFRVGLAYLVASWLLLQVIDVVGEILAFPDALARTVLFILAAGFIPALVIAWVYELTPEGLKLESEVRKDQSITPRTGRKLDRAIIVILALAVGLLLFDRLAMQGETELATEPLSQAEQRTSSPQVSPFGEPDAEPEVRSMAVLPFVAMSNGPDDSYFADGLTEEIINSMAQLPELWITARTSAFHYKGKDLPVKQIASELGVDHILEGSVRRAGNRLRISAQLIRAEDEFQLWSETYDRHTDDTFAVQTDIAEKVARALDILLDENLRARMQRTGTRNIDAFIAYQKGIEWYERAHIESATIRYLRRANEMFELAVALEPGMYPAYEYHSDLYSHILMDNGAGKVSGEITESDIESARAALKHDFDMAEQTARTVREQLNAEFGGNLFLGPWRGLAVLGEKAALTPGCEAAVWLHLITPFQLAEATLDNFQRMSICDPLRTRGRVHSVGSNVWLGEPEEAIRLVEGAPEQLEHPFLSQHLVLSLAFLGQHEDAKRQAERQIRIEKDRLFTRAMLAAIAGDRPGAETWLDRYLALPEADELDSLVLAATRGDRNEANRLAGLIDARPFSHLVLLSAVYRCICGAPFDLEATPDFAAMISESGLSWPPENPYSFPLKDW